jgi:NAD(P)-dependent dehydrogenase (short-subunit alcohol dehydrogenase family)
MLVMQNSRTWFITGISAGLGKALAEVVIENGDFLIGTFRQKEQADAFNQQHEDKAFALKMDITEPADIRQGFDTIEKRFGRLDVLVNNAGFGFAGAVEETTEQELRAVMEANFFGTWAVTKAALPLMRSQGSGRIFQISSHGGIKAFAGFGIYNASKFALEGMSEALAAEVEPLGIHLTIVEPGPFRTGFAGQAFREADARIAAYEATAGAFRERMRSVNGKQEGDPAKAASAIFEVSKLDKQPLRLPLGKVPLTTIQAKLDSVQRDLNDWRTVAEGVVF